MITIAMESKKKPPQDLATPLLSGICSEKKKIIQHTCSPKLAGRVYNSQGIAKKKKERKHYPSRDEQ